MIITFYTLTNTDTFTKKNDFTLHPDTLKAVRKWKLMDVRLKVQLTSALYSSEAGRQAEFEEISEAGITSPALIRVSKRPFFLGESAWGLRVQAGSGGCSVL